MISLSLSETLNKRSCEQGCDIAIDHATAGHVCFDFVKSWLPLSKAVSVLAECQTRETVHKRASCQAVTGNH